MLKTKENVLNSFVDRYKKKLYTRRVFVELNRVAVSKSVFKTLYSSNFVFTKN